MKSHSRMSQTFPKNMSKSTFQIWKSVVDLLEINIINWLNFLQTKVTYSLNKQKMTTDFYIFQWFAVV